MFVRNLRAVTQETQGSCVITSLLNAIVKLPMLEQAIFNKFTYDESTGYWKFSMFGADFEVKINEDENPILKIYDAYRITYGDNVEGDFVSRVFSEVLSDASDICVRLNADNIDALRSYQNDGYSVLTFNTESDIPGIAKGHSYTVLDIDAEGNVKLQDPATLEEITLSRNQYEGTDAQIEGRTYTDAGLSDGSEARMLGATGQGLSADERAALELFDEINETDCVNNLGFQKYLKDNGVNFEEPADINNAYITYQNVINNKIQALYGNNATPGQVNAIRGMYRAGADMTKFGTTDVVDLVVSGKIQSIDFNNIQDITFARNEVKIYHKNGGYKLIEYGTDRYAISNYGKNGKMIGNMYTYYEDGRIRTDYDDSGLNYRVDYPSGTKFDDAGNEIKYTQYKKNGREIIAYADGRMRTNYPPNSNIDYSMKYPIGSRVLDPTTLKPIKTQIVLKNGAKINSIEFPIHSDCYQHVFAKDSAGNWKFYFDNNDVLGGVHTKEAMDYLFSLGVGTPIDGSGAIISNRIRNGRNTIIEITTPSGVVTRFKYNETGQRYFIQRPSDSEFTNKTVMPTEVVQEIYGNRNDINLISDGGWNYFAVKDKKGTIHYFCASSDGLTFFEDFYNLSDSLKNKLALFPMVELSTTWN